MSVNIPPEPNVATFNNLYWINADVPLTPAEADLRYLKFPIAQGTENLQTTNVNGVFTANAASTFNAAVDMNNNNINDVGQLNFYNSGAPTTQTTAYTGAPAGTYTNTNMTIDANGKISAISNGSSVIPANLTPTTLTITPPSIPNSTAGIYNNYNQGALLAFSGSGGNNNGAAGIFAANTGVKWDFNYNFIPVGNVMKYRILFTFWNGSNWGQTKCDIDFFPNRWSQGQQSNDKYNINNKINGNANFVYSDPTYAPSGRQYWTYNQAFSGVSGSNGQFIPHQGYFNLYFAIPDNSYSWSGCIEALDTTAVQAGGMGIRIVTI